jgi:hypothetical protein
VAICHIVWESGRRVSYCLALASSCKEGFGGGCHDRCPLLLRGSSVAKFRLFKEFKAEFIALELSNQSAGYGVVAPHLSNARVTILAFQSPNNENCSQIAQQDVT